MKKKMYKAKKQWIIGLAAASLVTFVGVNQAKADITNGRQVRNRWLFSRFSINKL